MIEKDIQWLVSWAFREELPKRELSSTEGIWELIEHAGRFGIGPETRGNGGAQRYDLGLPHPDSLTIEKAVSALPSVAIDWELSREALMGDAAGLLDADKGGRDVLLLGSINVAALVVMHASSGTAPDWRTEPMWPYRMPAERGDPSRARVVGECRGANLYTAGSYCPLRWEPSPISVALARADYAAWHRGLTMLAETLQLAKHKALPPSAPARPWTDGPKKLAKVWFAGDPAAKQARLPLRPERGTWGYRTLTGKAPRKSRKISLGEPDRSCDQPWLEAAHAALDTFAGA